MGTIQNIDNKFKSGNSIEVERTQLTKQEWNGVKSEIDKLQVYLTDAEKENRELQAHLAACVYVLSCTNPIGWAMTGDDAEAGAWQGKAESTLTAEPFKKAKADAEVLRCAKAYSDAMNSHPEQDDFGDYLVDIVEAVRAAREAKNNE